jgi:hypothetical protein
LDWKEQVPPTAPKHEMRAQRLEFANHIAAIDESGGVVGC